MTARPDTGWLEEFMAHDYLPLVAAMALVCHDRGYAEDAVQEAACRAVLAVDRGRSLETPAAWIRVVALNLTRNRLRSTLRERRAVARLGSGSGSGDDSASWPSVDRSLDLQQAVATLPRREREAVALFYRLDLPIVEVAASMGVTEGTVKTLLHRARQSLATALGTGSEG
ncbi:MAG: RNA polymerase sigma factor [Actinomycetota bacterium]